MGETLIDDTENASEGAYFLNTPQRPSGLSQSVCDRYRRPTVLVSASLVVGLMFGAAAFVSRRAGPSLVQSDLAVAAPVAKLYEDAPKQCPGTVNIAGFSDVQLVNTKWNPGQMHIEGGAIRLHIEGRAYMATKCSDGTYNNNDYAVMPLLGKTVQFTVNMVGATCGCNVAFYFVSMNKNTNPTSCQDYYCDANSVCGVACAEIDIMEANNFVFRSTLHVPNDHVGGASGFGGTGPHQQAWTAKQYGPGSTCIDTNRPFDVHAHFPKHDGGKFQGMMVELFQAGSSCGVLTASVGYYPVNGGDGLDMLTETLAAGMVPAVSYWKSDNFQWLDGRDVSGEWPCPVDLPLQCPYVAPLISNIQYRDFNGFIHNSTMDIHPGQYTPTEIAEMR